jgi:WD40 repeat protein
MPIAGPTPSWTQTPNSGFQINSTALSADGSVLLTGTSIESKSSNGFAVYCYHTADGINVNLLWSDSLGQNAYDGVFWVALSADGNYAAAGGSYTQTGGGFLRLYSVSGGVSSRQEFATTSRVNEVEMSADGSVVVAVYGDQADVYVLANGKYSLSGSQSWPGNYIRTCGITPDGTWIVVGGDQDTGQVPQHDVGRRSEVAAELAATHTSDDDDAGANAGIVSLLVMEGGEVEVVGTITPGAGVRRVVITGAFLAASTRAGTITAWFRVMGPALQEAWTFTPTEPVGIIYALAIAQTDDATIWVGGGGNAGRGATGGRVFMIQSTPNASGSGFTAKQVWMKPTQYPPNPATNMDAGALYLTAADGEPTGTSETPGNFYLFDARTGDLQWSLPTSLMNWAMVINSTGTACFGGSDNGSLYYWGAPTASVAEPRQSAPRPR